MRRPVAVIRSMWTTDNDHGAQLQFHTGRHMLEGQFPTIGSWVHYGLGSLSDDLPRFVVIGSPIADCCGGPGRPWGELSRPRARWHPAFGRSPEPASVRLAGAETSSAKSRRANSSCSGRLNHLSALKYPDDPALRARIKSYELAFRMQTAVPEVMQLAGETPATERLYGLDHDVTRGFGQMCLAARRLVERGVRFVQVFHGSNGGAGGWDAHSGLRQNHADAVCPGRPADRRAAHRSEAARAAGGDDRGLGHRIRPHSRAQKEKTAAIITLMVSRSGWPAAGSRAELSTARPTRSATTRVENRHYVTDIHATLLHQLGLDPRRLEVPGHKRLEIDFGQVIREILA